MKSICLFICSIILVLNLFECSNKIKSLRKNNKKEEINLNENDETSSNNIHRTNLLKKSSLENKNISKFSNETTVNKTYFKDEPEIHLGNCFVKMHNHFYNLNPIDKLKEKYNFN